MPVTLETTPTRATLGAAMVAEERLRQITDEGYTPAHDDAHLPGDCAAAAVGYLLSGLSQVAPDCGWTPEQVDEMVLEGRPVAWPWEATAWKPADALRDLVRAGALIAAEIERLRRSQIRAAELEVLRDDHTPTGTTGDRCGACGADWHDDRCGRWCQSEEIGHWCAECLAASDA